uniref:Uncharacterized protein n=1 Tax=Timema cristinae TaxID=61476 RepID=A0A7R9GRC0_TIMCR|nr:unnamed protein product [Timema cristinae]
MFPPRWRGWQRRFSCLARLLRTGRSRFKSRFVVYKLPRIKKSDNELIQTGHAYTYITSKNVSSGWKLSTHSINDTTSIAGQTLKSLYDNGTKQDPGTLWILYNDQPPNGGVEIELGHTKGVVMSQSNGGFWLIHSVPHYPPSPNKSTHNAYSYPHTGLHYGQSLMCISLDAKQLDTVGIQLMYNEPEIYSVNTLGVLGNLFPNLMAAANNTRVQSAPWFHQAQINSLQGTKFSSFAKASHFHKDLYADWVAAALETDLVVESWTNGVGPMPSECSKQFKVENIQSVNVKVAATNFSSHLDHSKWALSVNNLTKSWVCVGDINRMCNALAFPKRPVMLYPSPLPSMFNVASQHSPPLLRGHWGESRALLNHLSGVDKRSRQTAGWDQSPGAELRAATHQNHPSNLVHCGNSPNHPSYPVHRGNSPNHPSYPVHRGNSPNHPSYMVRSCETTLGVIRNYPSSSRRRIRIQRVRENYDHT